MIAAWSLPIAYVGRRDPAAIFALIIAIVAVHLLIWLIGRWNVDNDWWRSVCVAFVGLVVGSAPSWFQGQGFLPAAGAMLFGAFVIFEICRALFDMEIWQRLVTALATPVIGILSLGAGILIRRAIFGW